jgi:hypothetical protein
MATMATMATVATVSIIRCSSPADRCASNLLKRDENRRIAANCRSRCASRLNHHAAGA